MASRPSLGESFIRIAAVATALLFVISLAAGAATYAFAFARTPDASAATRASLAGAMGIDLALFSAFALHHSVFARAGIKRWMTRVVPPRLERTSYVFAASVLFLVVCWWWVPVPIDIWHARAPWSAILTTIQWSGVVVTIVASRVLDVMDLSGLRQVMPDLRERSHVLIESGLYRLVRHPIYFGWLLMVWPAAHMTGSRFTFALVSTLYLLAAIPGEERALVRGFGGDYERYARRVPYRIVPFIY